MSTPPVVPEDVGHDLLREGYLADEGLATAIFLALRLGRPLFLEGEPGVGKTEVAKVLARVTGGGLLRLQCYEGIDAAQALYEWDYARQMLHLRVAEATGALAGGATDDVESQLYSERFLIRRPLLRALEASADGVRRPSCWSTCSTAPTTSSRPSCWRSSPTRRSRSPSSARSEPRSRPSS